jgi:hypothetical protein
MVVSVGGLTVSLVYRSKGREEEDKCREYSYIVERRAGEKGKSYGRVIV